jgi:hypothetical protein
MGNVVDSLYQSNTALNEECHATASQRTARKKNLTQSRKGAKVKRRSKIAARKPKERKR